VKRFRALSSFFIDIVFDPDSYDSPNQHHDLHNICHDLKTELRHFLDLDELNQGAWNLYNDFHSAATGKFAGHENWGFDQYLQRRYKFTNPLFYEDPDPDDAESEDDSGDDEDNVEGDDGEKHNNHGEEYNYDEGEHNYDGEEYNYGEEEYNYDGEEYSGELEEGDGHDGQAAPHTAY